MHEVQGLLALHGAAASSPQPDWPVIKKSVLRTLPNWAPDVEELIAFAVAKSGGVGGRFLHDFKAFHSQCVSSAARRVPGAVFGALADFKQTYCAYAILKAAYTCPPQKVLFGVCQWITGSTIDKEKKSDKVEAWKVAESVLAQARTIVLRPPSIWHPPILPNIACKDKAACPVEASCRVAD